MKLYDLIEERFQITVISIARNNIYGNKEKITRSDNLEVLERILCEQYRSWCSIFYRTKATLERKVMVIFSGSIFVWVVLTFLSFKKRFWWIFAFSLAMGLCSSTIQDTWTKWHVNPMIMSIAEKEASITEIAFPTITICSQTKALKSKLDWISIFGTKKPHNITNTE